MEIKILLIILIFVFAFIIKICNTIENVEKIKVAGKLQLGMFKNCSKEESKELIEKIAKELGEKKNENIK